MTQPLDPILVEFLAGGCTDLDRADGYLTAGRHKDAIAIYSAAFYEDCDRTRAAAWAARCCLEMRVPHEALVWARYVADADPELGFVLMAAAYCQLGEFDAASAVAVDVDADALLRVGLGPEHAVQVRSAVAWHQGRPDRARDELLAALDAGLNPPSMWAQLAQTVEREGFAVPAVLDAAERFDTIAVAAWLREGSPAGAELVIDGLWSRHPGSRSLMAAAAECAPGAPIDRALEWSNRLRMVGLVDVCPVRTRAGLERLAAIERVEAAVLCAVAFGDADAGDLLTVACAALPTEEVRTALTVVAELQPDLLEAAINGAAEDVPRSLVAARFLYDCELVEAALAVTAHALQLADADPVWTAATTAQALRDAFDAAAARVLADGYETAGAGELAAQLRAIVD